MSFLVFEVKNYVGCLINCYNYMYSMDYKQHQTFTKNIALENFLDISSKRLHQKFLDSKFWMSQARIYDAYEYYEKLDNIESLFEQCVRSKIDFYHELAGYSINLKLIIKSAKKIKKCKNEIEKLFEDLSSVQLNNSRLVSLYLNYQLNIKLQSENELKIWFEKLHFILKSDRSQRTLTKLQDKKSGMNIFSNNNMVVFVNILKSKFFISKFSSKVPEYFEYQPSEMKGMLISHILPKEIQVQHDRFMLDFINQKVSPIIKTGALTSFCQTKTNDLRMMGVIVKLEYYMTDDVYLAGLMIPHPKNEQILILSNDQGKIISMNQQANQALGSGVKDNPYRLFLSMPLLVKYFYPKVKRALKYKKLIKQKKQENGNDEEKKDKNVNCDIFDAYLFKFLLSDKLSTRGMIEQDKEGIMKNFFNREEIVLSKNSSQQNLGIFAQLILPKHMRILAGVISNNRQLITSMKSEIKEANVSLESYQHRGDLRFKLIIINKIKNTSPRVKEFFNAAAQKMSGDLGDIFLIRPEEIGNMCNFFYL